MDKATVTLCESGSLLILLRNATVWIDRFEENKYERVCKIQIHFKVAYEQFMEKTA